MKEKKKKKTISIVLAVRDFATPALRSGSIDIHSGYGSSGIEGMEMHGVIQTRLTYRHKEYRKEVAVKWTFDYKKYAVRVQGRIDGIFDWETPLIEEIKSTVSPRELEKRLLANEHHPYVLQLQTYAHLYHLTTSTVPQCRFRLVSTRSKGEKLLDIHYDPEEFSGWITERLEEIAKQHQEKIAWRQRRRKTSESLKFPFPGYRPGQEELIDTVGWNVEAGNKLLAQAPTGLGKTAGVLFPALRHALKRGTRTFYVTPKNSQHQLAVDLVERLRNASSNVRCVTITAKKKVCLKDEAWCTPEYCEYARDYYDKFNRHGLLKKMASKTILEAQDFRRFATRFEVCPFELSIDAIEKKDLVIGDYNYVFSPVSALSRFFTPEGDDEELCNLVVDEVHNLHDRAMDYFSPEISEGVLADMLTGTDVLPAACREEVRELINRCLACLFDQQPDKELNYRDSALIEPNAQEFYLLEKTLTEHLADHLDKLDEPIPGDTLIAATLYWRDFCSVLRIVDEKFFITYRRQHQGDSIKITCCDASEHLQAVMAGFASAVGFSATLKPFEYYARLSGFSGSRLSTAEFASPFPKDNRKIMVIPQVATNYRERSHNYPRIAEAIERILQVKQGNYFVFFPSYGFLESVDQLMDLHGFRVFKQRPGQTRSEVEDLAAKLRDGTRNVVILAVQGGSLAEGVDFPGDDLIGAIIVGPALPQFSFERDKLRRFFDEQFGEGFNYAYTYPAMARSVQAAGRVIRSEADRGLIVLMDRRFVHPEYTRTMPGDWFADSVKELVSTNILDEINDFWHWSEDDDASGDKKHIYTEP